MKRPITLSLIVVVSLALVWPSIGWADLVTDSPNLPPLHGQYVSDGLFLSVPSAIVMLTDVVQHAYTQSWTPPALGMTEVHTFNELIDGQLSYNGGGILLPFSVPAVETDRITCASNAGNVWEFDTEMLQLDITHQQPFPEHMFRESPTLPSLGHTTITDLGNGNYHIDSFFDVFMETSFDHGQTWLPSEIGPSRLTLTGVPEPSSLVLLAAGLLALACLRRRLA